MQGPEKSAKEIFFEALELPIEERAAFLDIACGDNPALRAEVQSLLDARDKAGGFMGGPTVEQQEFANSVSHLTDSERQIGHYKLLQIIGEGGFGTVYMAEQEKPVRRRVALKIIKLGMDTRQVVARFEAERQALAMMDHPNIAKVFDAGATASGRPFFVMELVNGVPVTEYCDRNLLTPRQRLELFIPVCQAVQHAHQKGIIHRDIKPTNVLVTLHDGNPVTKVIDFGIAKATQARLTEKTLFTEFRQMIGTPEYMSPEQAEMSGLDIDTRSDIYSLGVLLYELLTGTTPFDSRELRSKAYAEIQRVIREVDPPKPSTRLSAMRGDTLPLVAAHRNIEPRKLNTLVRGELDWIVMKCLEKDRTRRYDSAAGLAADVVHFLADEPVLAASPSAAYRLRKFARRHKVGVGAGAAVVLALIIGLAVATWALRQAQHERDIAIAAREAEAEAREHERETDKFLRGMFESIDPEQARGKPVLVREILDQAAARIDRQPPEHPIVEASLRYTFGTAYNALGLPEEARRQLEKASEIYRRVKGQMNPSTANALTNLGMAYSTMGRGEDALRTADEAILIHDRVHGPDHADSINSKNLKGELLVRSGKYDDAARIYEELLPQAKRVCGPDSREYLTVVMSASTLYERLGDYAQMQKMLRESYATARRVYGDDHVTTVGMMANLGDLLRTSGQFDEAVPMLLGAHETAKRVFGEDHPSTLSLANNLALVLQTVGRFDESIAVYEDTIERRARTLGHDHPLTLLVRSNYGIALQATGKLDEADAVYRDVAARMKAVLGADHRDTIIAENNVAWLKTQRGDHEVAEQIYQDLVPRARTAFGSDSPVTVGLGMRLGHVLMMRQKWADAEPVLAEAYRGAQKLGIANVQAGYASAYGMCLVNNHKPKEGLPLLLAANDIMDRLPKVDPLARLRLIEQIILGYEQLGSTDDVQRWRKKREVFAPSTQPVQAAATAKPS